ncbi:hypothetical protein F5887DRAFT_1079558 [Amanita rubescens]|nr:hypothetical protein F5887DRAFT_1079558 [Amanita rubescens]
MAESDADSAADEEAWEAVYQLRLQRRPLILKAYAPRSPMQQLGDEFRVTKSNPNPPNIHYGIPLESKSPF